jgi:mannosyltransferase
MRRKQVPIVLTLLIAFGLRLWGLADHNIWWDEGLAAWAARLPVAGILHWTAHDVHPPLYFLLLRGCWLIVGEGEFVLRFPSVLAGVLGVSLIYRLGRALGGRRAGLLAALFLALSRFAVTWSQEMRMYIWASTLATGALWAAARLWRSRGRDRRAWATYVLSVAGGLWTLFLTISVPLIANLAFVAVWLRQGRPGRPLKRWIGAQLAAAALFVPWLVYALPRMPTWSTAEPFSPAFFLRLYATMLALGIPVDIQVYAGWVAAVFGVLLVGLIALARSPRTPAQTGGLSTLALGLTLPALVVYAVSLSLPIYYTPRLAPRYLLPLSVCFYTLLGWGLAVLAQKRPWAAALGAGLVVVVALTGLAPLFPGRARRDDYVSLAATLRAHRRSGDALLLHTDKDWPIFAAHYAGDWRGAPHGQAVGPEEAERLLDPLWDAQTQGLWLALTPDAQRNDPAGHVNAWLAERAVASARWRFGESDLYFYARTPERAERLHDLAPGFEPPVSLVSPVLPDESSLQGAEIPLPRYQIGDTLHLFLYWRAPPDPPDPPDLPVTVQLRQGGIAHKTVTATVAHPARAGLTRQQIDLPLTADLPPGAYAVVVQPPGELEVEVGRVTLARRGAISGATGGVMEAGDIAHPRDLRLGETIRFLGYDLKRSAVAPGEMIELTLYWQTSVPVETRYKVFTHLLGDVYNPASGNFLWGQQDNEPVNDQAPTTSWAPEVVIVDDYAIPVAADAPPGLYQLEIGMYGLLDGRRLPVFEDGERVGDHIFLQTIEVQAP